MLKAMDNVGRLTIVSHKQTLPTLLNIFHFQVDGDTDTQAVQEDFINVVKEHIDYIKSKIDEESLTNNQVANGQISNGHIINNNTNASLPKYELNGVSNGNIPNGLIGNDTELVDLENEPIATISQRVGNGVAHTITNGVIHPITNGVTHTVANGVQKLANGYGLVPSFTNGVIANGQSSMYSEHI